MQYILDHTGTSDDYNSQTTEEKNFNRKNSDNQPFLLLRNWIITHSVHVK